MQLKRLTLTQFRAFEQATLDFQPGMNLLVGVNGVGKSSVLDVLRIVLSRALPGFTAARRGGLSFGVSDITVTQDWLYAAIQFDLADLRLEYEAREWREKYGTINVKEGEVRAQTDKRRDVHRLRVIPEPDELVKDIPRHLKNAAEQPLAVYFSTRRSLSSMAVPSKQSIAGGQAAAFADALTHRELRIVEFAEWWLAQKALASEGAPLAKRRLDVLEDAVTRFLNTFTNVRAVPEPETTLLMDKDGVTLDVRQLSDGERGILALVLDLARRLSQANPNLEDPLRDGRAVVLIDELDLHLHPQWQRAIVEKLTRTFPNCQFIATTHSPQIIGEVAPDLIILLESGRPPYRPDQSLGMDSNWVLRFIMGTEERDLETKQKLERIADLIEDEQYDEATAAIDALHAQLGDFPELVRLQTRIDRIRLLGE